MPDSNLITTSIVISFSPEGSSGYLSAEIDGRPEGFNGGKTQFSPGESPVFLVYKSADVTIVSIEPSAGNVAPHSTPTGLTQHQQFMQFPKTTEGSLDRPIEGPLTHKWLGANLGVPTVVGDTKIVIPTLGVGVLKLNYESRFLAYKLSGLGTTLNGESTYEVLIFITGTTVPI
jgi:hypothetical protein